MVVLDSARTLHEIDDEAIGRHVAAAAEGFEADARNRLAAAADGTFVDTTERPIGARVGRDGSAMASKVDSGVGRPPTSTDCAPTHRGKVMALPWP